MGLLKPVDPSGELGGEGGPFRGPEDPFGRNSLTGCEYTHTHERERTAHPSPPPQAKTFPVVYRTTVQVHSVHCAEIVLQCNLIMQ